MALLTVDSINRDGIIPNLVPCDVAGDTFVNTTGVFLYLDNKDVGDKTVHLHIQTVVDGQGVPPRDVLVPAGSVVLVGPFPQQQYNDTDGVMTVTYSDVTSLSIQALR